MNQRHPRLRYTIGPAPQRAAVWLKRLMPYSVLEYSMRTYYGLQGRLQPAASGGEVEVGGKAARGIISAVECRRRRTAGPSASIRISCRTSWFRIKLMRLSLKESRMPLPLVRSRVVGNPKFAPRHPGAGGMTRFKWLSNFYGGLVIRMLGSGVRGGRKMAHREPLAHSSQRTA